MGLYWSMFYSAGYGSGYNERKAQIEASHYASDTSNQIERECSAKTGQAVHKCIAEIVKFERESQRNERDLAAQWKAADWALWAGVIAGAQLIATLAGLYYVKRTLDATLKAVEDTGNATKAMERQNEIAIAAQRAWVTVEVSIEEITISYGRVYYDYKIKYKNIGQTIANEFAAIVNFKNKSPIDYDEIKSDRSLWLTIWKRNQTRDAMALMPGEVHISEGSIDYAISELPLWGQQKIAQLVINAGAIYVVPTQADTENPKMTIRSFRIAIDGGKGKLLDIRQDILTPGSLRACTVPLGILVTT